MKIVMNPMMLMAGVMIVFSFYTPNMKMDPEAMEAMKEMQKNMNSGWLANLLQPPQ